MAVTVKKAVLWRKEIDNRPGMLADTLGPLAEAGAACKSLWPIAILVKRIRPPLSYIRCPAGSR